MNTFKRQPRYWLRNKEVNCGEKTEARRVSNHCRQTCVPLSRKQGDFPCVLLLSFAALHLCLLAHVFRSNFILYFNASSFLSPSPSTSHSQKTISNPNQHPSQPFFLSFSSDGGSSLRRISVLSVTCGAFFSVTPALLTRLCESYSHFLSAAREEYRDFCINQDFKHSHMATRRRESVQMSKYSCENWYTTKKKRSYARMQKTILCFWEEYEWDPGARHKNLLVLRKPQQSQLRYLCLCCFAFLSWKLTISLFCQTDRGEHQLIAWGFREELTGNGQQESTEGQKTGEIHKQCFSESSQVV